MMIRLDNGTSRLLVDPSAGGRIASLSVRGTELIAGPTGDDGEPRPGLEWGLYPMVPFAGRVRNGQFGFAGVRHSLEPRAHPHAIHGTVDDAAWEVISTDATTVTMVCSLGPRWPFRGLVTHRIVLSAGMLRLVLALRAEEPMPAQVGWHPWFRRPASVPLDFAQWLPRDADGMPGPPTAGGMPSSGDPVDDCFVADGRPVALTVDGVRLGLSSDCSHWVVYDGAAHGVCVEPQSGPPNAIVSSPHVVAAGQVLERWFEISWAGD